jgi:hypothetical protein
MERIVFVTIGRGGEWTADDTMRILVWKVKIWILDGYVSSSLSNSTGMQLLNNGS